MPLFTPGGFIHPTEGMNHERITQKVAGAAARRGGVHHGAGDLCPAVIYCGAEFSFGTVLSRSKSWSLEAFAFIFTDPDFYLALRSGFILAFGLGDYRHSAGRYFGVSDGAHRFTRPADH